MRRGAVPFLLGAAALLLASGPALAAGDDRPTTLVYPPFRHTLGVNKATSNHLKVYLGPEAAFRDPQGVAAVKLRSWDDPKREGDDDELTLFGVNSGAGQILYNSSMATLGVFGRPGSGPGEFQGPRGIAADEEGRVYVADTGNRRVARLRVRGHDSLEWAGAIGPGDFGGAPLMEPLQVAADYSGRVYVTDRAGGRVVAFDTAGTFLEDVGPQGPGASPFVLPEGLAVMDSRDPWSFTKQFALFVADQGRTRIRRLARTGRVERVVEAHDLPIPGATFSYLAVDHYGNLYATDPALHRVHKFDRDLHYLTSFGGQPEGAGHFVSPRGIAIWKRFGQVFVVEADGAQYYWVGSDILFPDGEAPLSREANGEFQLHFVLTERSELSAVLRDRRGKEVRTVVSGLLLDPGAQSLTLPGLGGSAQRPPGGDLLLRVSPTYSSRGFFEREKEIPLENGP